MPPGPTRSMISALAHESLSLSPSLASAPPAPTSPLTRSPFSLLWPTSRSVSLSLAPSLRHRSDACPPSTVELTECQCLSPATTTRSHNVPFRTRGDQWLKVIESSFTQSRARAGTAHAVHTWHSRRACLSLSSKPPNQTKQLAPLGRLLDAELLQLLERELRLHLQIVLIDKPRVDQLWREPLEAVAL